MGDDEVETSQPASSEVEGDLEDGVAKGGNGRSEYQKENTLDGVPACVLPKPCAERDGGHKSCCFDHGKWTNKKPVRQHELVFCLGGDRSMSDYLTVKIKIIKIVVRLLPAIVVFIFEPAKNNGIYLDDFKWFITSVTGNQLAAMRLFFKGDGFFTIWAKGCQRSFDSRFHNYFS